MNDIHLKFCDVSFYEIVDVADRILKEPSFSRLCGNRKPRTPREFHDEEIRKMICRVNGEDVDNFASKASMEADVG